jgi:hypothetical protein
VTGIENPLDDEFLFPVVSMNTKGWNYLAGSTIDFTGSGAAMEEQN